MLASNSTATPRDFFDIVLPRYLRRIYSLNKQLPAPERKQLSLVDCGGDQLSISFRTSPSGSFTTRHSLSNTIVWPCSGSAAGHARSGWLGSPVRAKFDQAIAIFFAIACASGVLPVPCSQRLVLSKQKASSAVCHAPAPSSMGDCQLK